VRINTGSTTALNKLADQSRMIRSRFEPDWYLNLAHFLGDQWVWWNHGRLDKPVGIPEHVQLVTENMIMPVILTRLAKKTKQRPVWTTIPNSGDDADISAAELSERIMEGKWRDLCMQEKLFDVLMWADICCAGFWKICWDGSAGKKVEVVIDANGNPMQDENGRLLYKSQVPSSMAISTKTISQGEVSLEVRNPFEILPDPLAKDIDSCEWIIEEVVQSEEYVRSHFDVELSGDTEVSAGPSDSRFFPAWRMGGSTSYKGVKVRELWLKSNTQFSKGRHVVWAKDKVLRDEDNHYEGLPYVMFSGVQVPGRFWPTSLVDQLREPQIELNKAKTQIRQNAQRIGNPALLKDRNAQVFYSGVPGEEVLYDGTMANAAPSYLQPPEMPRYVSEDVDRILNTIREISGQHEVSNATVPTGVTAAAAINLLLEQDDTRLGVTITEMETSLGYSGQMVLKLIAEYYQEERMVTLVGEDSAYDFISFRGASLKGNTQVEVQAGSQFPSSKAAQQAAIANTLTLFVQNQQYAQQPLDPRVLRRVLRDYQVGGLEAFFSDIAKDESQVNRENRLLYNGQPLPINDYDDDPTHIAGHEDEMKSSRFFRSPRQVQAVWQAHVSLHKERESARGQDAARTQLQQETLSDQARVGGDLLKIQANHMAKLEEDLQNAMFELQRVKIQANANARRTSNQGSNS
jgi:hypothetical protein